MIIQGARKSVHPRMGLKQALSQAGSYTDIFKRIDD